MSRRHYDLPLIAPSAIEAYLTRELADYSFLKGVSREELVAYARELGYRYATDPRTCQLVVNIIAAQEPEFLFYLDMGAGKSKSVLDIIRWRKSRGELQRALIASPEFVHVWSWEEQIKEHAPDLRYVFLLGDKNDRYELIDKKADLYLINYAGLQVYMSEKRKGKKKYKGEEIDIVKRGVETNAAALFASMFNFVLFEEIHRIRSHESLTFRLCSWLREAAAFKYATTGSPFGRDLQMLWPQFKIVDDGETFGQLGLFRAAFFNAKKKYFGGYDYKFKEDMYPQLNRLMKHRSIVYEEHELNLQLPKVTRVKKPIKMTPEMRMYYSRIIDRMKEAKGDYSSKENVFLRFRQCASGFLSLKADDESEIEVDMTPNPKLDAMKEIVLDLPPGEKFIVFYQFHHSGLKLRELFDKMGVRWSALFGRQRMAAEGLDSRAEYQRFIDDKKCQAAVWQLQAASEAVNPHKICRWLWFYERPDDPVTSLQAEKRVNRPEQPRPCFLGDLTVVGSIEEKLLEYVQDARNVRKAVFTGEALK